MKKIIGLFICILFIGATMPSIGSINNIESISNGKIETNDLSIEFELADELIISWPKDIYGDEQSDIEFYFIDLVKNSEDALSVNIVIDSVDWQSTIESTLQDNNIPLDNITFTTIRTNSIWIRDYGPFFVEENSF